MSRISNIGTGGSSGGGGSTNWGSIGGILSNQTDLQSALNAKLTALSNLSDLGNVNTALNTILPSQTGNSGKFLTTNGSNTSWATASGGISSYARAATKIVAASNSLDTTNADYICTGTNDHTTINTAIAALPSGGGRVLLMEGTYTLGGAVVLNKSNVTLEGQGNATILKLANAINTDCIDLGDGISSYTNIVVKNILVDGNMANQTGGNAGIYVQATVSYFKIEECTVQNTYALSGAIWISSFSDDLYGLIANNIVNTTKVGVFGNGIGGSGKYIDIIGNIVISTDNNGIHNNFIQNCIIANNIVITPTGQGIYTGGTGTTIAGNLIINSSDSAIKNNTSDCTVTGNNIYCTNNPSHALILLTGQGGSCANNTIYVTTGNSAAVTGIADNSGFQTISGNFIQMTTSQAHVGISSNGQSNNNITGNIIYMNSGGTSSYGFNFSSGMSQSLFSGNYINGPDIAADFSFGSNLQIMNNEFIQINTGIILTGCTQSVFSGNQILGNVANQRGLTFDTNSGNQYNTISNNIIVGFGQEGMYLKEFQYGIVSNNIIQNVGQQTTNTYAGILLTDTGAIYSKYNTITGNSITSNVTNKPQYGIRENASSDGPNIITSNICLNAVTAQISTQNANTDVSHNITS